ncbi:MAG: helix-turn-helix transcriptional regulator [Oligoflexia bacterium]|nr:helix-turn-helix transcriptional regulator [Oligoflexia bacterium]
MKGKDLRGYRKQGLLFSDIEFSSRGERIFVKRQVERLAEKIAKTRKARGISQEKLAELASVSISTIKFIEQHQRTPSLAVLLKIMYALDRNAVLWK